MASFSEPSELQPPATKPKFLPNTSGSGVAGATCAGALAIGIQNNGGSGSSDETPIFSKRKMLLRIPAAYSGDFTHLTVSKNWLVCLLAAPQQTTLLRFFLPRALPPGEIALEKYLSGYKISKIFFDPTGHHMLVSLVPKSPGLSADFLYIHGNGPKVRRIEKFKDHEITAVAFNRYNGTESSTGPILLGTSRGLIFETELSQEADKPSQRKQVYDLGLGRSKYPITGLELLCTSNSNNNNYIVVATAPDCIYTFQETLKPEEKSLQAIFAGYVNGTKVHNAETVKTDMSYSVLRFFAQPNEKFPSQWGWLCGDGIQVGEVSADSNASDKVLPLSHLISLDLEQRKHLTYEERRQNIPKSFVLTEYHALLLYADHITGICLLNQEIVYEEYFHEQIGKLLHIVRDHFTGSIYVYTDKTIFNYKINDEERNIWQIYLQKGLFDLAELYAAENPKHLNEVRERKALADFDAQQYERAASIYADTEKTFEEVCLKFMVLEEKRPIILYVKKRLQKLNACVESDRENAQQLIKVLVVWLVDLYLTQINLPNSGEEHRAAWQREFDEWMKDECVVRCTRDQRQTIQALMEEHADAHNLAQFAIANGDYEEVITQHLNAEHYIEALHTLRQQKNMDLYYKFCPILIEMLPVETVEALMAQGRKLQIEQLVPTLITIDSPRHVEEIIKYLEYAIYNLGETHRAVHNFLLRLYAEHKPSSVIAYLRNEGHDVSLVHYDINYALNVCMEFEAKVACVFLQCLLRMWSAAVDLALTFNVQLAKETASKPRDEETRRKLWLRIAYHDIQDTNDVKKALDLLKECDLLRIEDLLPFFSDFEKIDDFKEPICHALKEYNQKMQELQHDMEECTKQAERVRDDLQNIRERSVRIEAHETCAICESFLLIKPFFIFICGHKCHSDCLEKQVIPMLSSDKSRKLTMLKQQLEALLTQSIAMAGQSSQKQQRKREQLKQEIEEILAADCIYCGLMIDTIDQPFVEDWDQVNVDWE